MGDAIELLSEKNLLDDPVEQFSLWLADARRWADMDYPEAGVLSTVSPEGRPEGRVVLLKAFDPRGFVFYTNMLSPKGLSINAHPAAALTFYWPKLMRQVRVAGATEEVTDAEADAYWRSRPRESRLGARASEQSAALESRALLESRVRGEAERFPGEDVPRPRHWTGIRIRPDSIEFWQDGMYRLHDRFRFTRAGSGWDVSRLYP
ncbi:MAG: pyridoxamine 5'-phosphate oxidase [Elusimicrobia bacterium]|nr:pyridoxamine 5'-phosphate oxidase [Elusimicrobiota bacterium]